MSQRFRRFSEDYQRPAKQIRPSQWLKILVCSRENSISRVAVRSWRVAWEITRIRSPRWLCQRRFRKKMGGVGGNDERIHNALYESFIQNKRVRYENLVARILQDSRMIREGGENF